MYNQRDRLSLNSKKLFGWGFALLIGMALIGCSSVPKTVIAAQDMLPRASDDQRSIRVKTSRDDNRPEWTKRSYFEKDRKVCFSGGFMKGVDYSVSVRCANAEALKVAAQSLSHYIRTEFSEYVEGSNTGTGGIERYIKDGIATFTGIIHAQGIRQSEIYYEEVANPSSTIGSTFNVFVMLEMEKADYLRAKADALGRMRDKFSQPGNRQAKEKAEKLLEDLKREIREQSLHT